MKKRNAFLFVLTLFLGGLLFSCSDDENDNLLDENGFTRKINEFIPQDILNELETLGFNLYPGANPPAINGTFVSSPHVLYASNSSSDDIGKTYTDKTFKFANQNNDNLTVTVTITQGSNIGTGIGGYLVGDNNKFTVFVEINFEDKEEGEKYTAAQIITGEMTDAGIKGLMSAFVMLDDNGDPTDSLAPVGRIRIIKDNDNLGEIASGNKSAQISNLFSESNN